jgi:hypothetical protein
VEDKQPRKGELNLEALESNVLGRRSA